MALLVLLPCLTSCKGTATYYKYNYTADGKEVLVEKQVVTTKGGIVASTKDFSAESKSAVERMRLPSLLHAGSKVAEALVNPVATTSRTQIDTSGGFGQRGSVGGDTLIVNLPGETD